MTNNNDFTELRRKAEHNLRDEKFVIKDMSEDDILKTIHELHVHQIELEMQNEELRRARVELEDSCNKYTDLFDFAPIGYFVLDKKGVIEQVNLTGTSMLGIERSFLLEKPFSLYISKEDMDIFYSNRREVFKTGSKTRCDLKMIIKGKGEFFAEILIEPIKDGDGQVIRCRVALVDVTARKKAEEALRVSEFCFRLALRNAPVSVAAQDRDLRYIWAYNQKIAKPEEIIGRFDEDIFTEEEAAFFRDIKQRVLIEGSEFSEQMWVSRPNGRMFLHITWEPVFDKNGNITGVASSTIDMTPIKLAEEKLRQKNEELSRFNKYAVGRELRMIELKKEINMLYEAKGEPPRYKIDF